MPRVAQVREFIELESAGDEKLKDAFASWGHESTGIEREESGWKVDTMNLLHVLYRDLDSARVDEPADREQLADLMKRHGYRIEGEPVSEEQLTRLLQEMRVGLRTALRTAVDDGLALSPSQIEDEVLPEGARPGQLLPKPEGA
jgi:hypothetical protein